jgi:hypothetical protein
MTLHTFAPRPVEQTAPAPVKAAPVAVRPVMTPTTVATSPARTTFNPAFIYMRNPSFGWFLGTPQPRSGFALPTLISPVAPPVDSTLFEEPQDATKKHYLVQYAIATRGSGASSQRWVTFAPTSGSFTLTVHLIDASPTALAQGNAAIVPGATRYLLTANVGGQAQSWDFSTAATDAEAGGLVLSLVVTDQGVRDQIYHAMTDESAQAKLILRRSFSVATPVPPPTSGPAPAQPLYRSAVTAIDSTLPFNFDPVLDKNVFAGLSGIGSGESSLHVTQVTWQGRSYPYYQDLNDASQVYFLPDSFKISRQPAAPRAPSIVVSTDGDDPNSLTFTLTFLAVPVWDPKRLAAAAQPLQTTLGLAALPAFTQFTPVTTATALSLTVPPSDASAAPGLVAQPGAEIDMAAGIKCSLALSMAQFRQVYAALFEQVTQLLSGLVTVSVVADSGPDVEQVPLVSSAADFAGEIFASTTSFDPLKNQLTVIVENGIESPIHVGALPAELLEASGPVTTVNQQITPAPPLDLKPVTTAAATPGSAAPAPDTLTIVMQLGAGQAIDSTCSVQFDYSNTQVEPDPAAIWEAIMQNNVVAPVKRDINVILFSSVFAAAATAATAPVTAGGGPATSSAPAPAASPPIMAVQVVFADGQTANFDASTPAINGVMTQTISLSVPVEAYVLQSGDTSNYTYRVDIVTSAGTTQGTPVTSNQDSFYVQAGS